MTQPTPPLAVPVDHVARLAGLDATDEQVQYVVEAAIRSAMVAAQAYLKRFVTPTQVTEQHLVPAWPGDRWELQHSPIVEILSVTAELDSASEPTGRYTVVYLAGVDARSPECAPIQEWITAAAQVHPTVRRLLAQARLREVKTVSAEGQSVTYEAAPSSKDVPTAGVPAMSTMDYWRNADGLVFQRPGDAAHFEYRHDWWRR